MHAVQACATLYAHSTSEAHTYMIAEPHVVGCHAVYIYLLDGCVVHTSDSTSPDSSAAAVWHDNTVSTCRQYLSSSSVEGQYLCIEVLCNVVMCQVLQQVRCSLASVRMQTSYCIGVMGDCSDDSVWYIVRISSAYCSCAYLTSSGLDHI
jgi:hypothetical protein